MAKITIKNKNQERLFKRAIREAIHVWLNNRKNFEARFGSSYLNRHIRFNYKDKVHILKLSLVFCTIPSDDVLNKHVYQERDLHYKNLQANNYGNNNRSSDGRYLFKWGRVFA